MGLMLCYISTLAREGGPVKGKLEGLDFLNKKKEPGGSLEIGIHHLEMLEQL